MSLTYEEWLEHLEEKEREKHPLSEKERLELLLEVIYRAPVLFGW